MVSLIGYDVLSGKMQVERHEMTLSICLFPLASRLQFLGDTYITLVTNPQNILVDVNVIVEEVGLVCHVCKDAPNSSCQVNDRRGLELLKDCSCCGQVSGCL